MTPCSRISPRVGAWAALRPGGWILLLAFSTPGIDLDAALLRLASVAYSGDALYPEQVAELLADADFARTQVFPSPAGSIPRPIVGQRPPTLRNLRASSERTDRPDMLSS